VTMSRMKKSGEAMNLSVEQLQKELNRVRYKRQYAGAIKSTISSLIVAAALVLIAVVSLPVMHVSGDSMLGTLADGDIIVTRRTGDVAPGDLVVFFSSGGKLLVKRLIAEAGDEVNITGEGTVTVNGEAIDEPYVANPTRGEYDIELPYVIPQGCVFVLGDNRAISVDSRNSALGCVAEEQIIGKAMVKIWPLVDIQLLGAID